MLEEEASVQQKSRFFNPASLTHSTLRTTSALNHEVKTFDPPFFRMSPVVGTVTIGSNPVEYGCADGIATTTTDFACGLSPSSKIGCWVLG